ncbi:MAG TPA: hypothetical protein VGB82_07040 [Alphaproteobacteria bacterium]
MRESRTGERLIAIFLFGCLAIDPPLMAIFRTEILIAGVPVLFLYLFAVWAVLIGLLALIIERESRSERERNVPDPAASDE